MATTTEERNRALLHLDRNRCSICGETFSGKEIKYETSAVEIRERGKRAERTFRVVVHDHCMIIQELH